VGLLLLLHLLLLLLLLSLHNLYMKQQAARIESNGSQTHVCACLQVAHTRCVSVLLYCNLLLAG
jgi:hypothetical protein